VLDWFGGKLGFEDAHTEEIAESTISTLIADDW
jgi:hypothetical protein